MTDSEINSHDSAQADATAGNFSFDKRAVGTGAFLGGLATLAGTLSLKDVLQDNPFIALAVFALLGSFLVFSLALTGPTSRMWPKASFAIALLLAGVAAGAAAVIRGPERVNLVVEALPSLSEAKPIRLGEYAVSWGSPTPMRAGGRLTLDLSGVETYYNTKAEAARGDCVATLKLLAPHLNIGPGAPSSPPPPKES